jgi:hypothetical protein
MRKTYSLFLAVLLLPAIAVAAPQSGMNASRTERMLQMLEQKFDTANTSHDGKLTQAQAQAGMPRIAQHFNEIDTNRQGYITLDQIKAFVVNRAAP